jgi:outer membrane protein TolC
VLARVGIVGLLTAISLAGTWALLPPADYLPVGNRNLVFGLIIPPPGVSLDQQEALSLRVEETFRPYFEAGRLERDSEEYAAAVDALPSVPTFDFATMSPGPPLTAPPLSNYFFVSFPGTMFHGGICAEPERIADLLPLFRHAARPEVLPGSMAFAFQVPLFQLGGRSGSAVEINFSGDSLEQVSQTASSVFLQMIEQYGPYSIQPSPNNFDLPTPELQVVPDLRRLAEVGMTPAELGLAVRALGDGAILGDFVVGSQTIDLKLISQRSLADAPLAELGDQPLATRAGGRVPLSSLAELRRVDAPGQVNRTGRRRAVTLQFTPPAGMPLGTAIDSVDTLLSEGRADGTIPFDVATSYTGSASRLDAVKAAMLGDGTLGGTLGSSLVLSLLVVYLLMCVLFQSFLRPLVILFSVPLATLGGFAALSGVHAWSASDPYMPVQNLDILTMLGFVILVGVVVNNAILIVHQASNFMRGAEHGTGDAAPLAPREAIREAVRSRVRPIFMGTLTSVGGMSPLIFMPGAGSELYRGLGSVVVGGLLVSTLFTLVLVPLLLSLLCDLQQKLGLLPELRERDTAGDVTARVATVASLLVLSTLMVGCDAPQPNRTPLWGQADRILEQRLATALEADAAERTLALQAAPVDEVVANRRAELEALGGPESYRLADHALTPDLTGAAQRTAPLTLRDAVGAATEHNLGLRLAGVRAAIDEQGVTVESAAFDTVVFSTVELEDAQQPNRVPVLGGVVIGAGESAQRRATAELGMRRLLASGATVSMSGFLERLENETSGIDFAPDPAWRSGLSFGVTQPLLRGRGSAVATADLELSALQHDISTADRLAELLFLVALTEQAYWDLTESWEALGVRRRLAAQGARVERVLRERLVFDAGQAEYSDALATLQRRKAELLRAERIVRAASDNLKALMRTPEHPLAAETVLVPRDPLTDDPPTFRLVEALTTALRNRPEVERARLQIEDAELRERVAASDLRPQLDLGAEVLLAGLDEGAASTFESLAQDDQLTLLLGLTYENPLGSRAASAARQQARLQSRDALLRFDQAVDDVVLEVKGALRDLETSFALIGATRATRLAETENLRTIQLEEESRSRLTPEFLNLKFQRQERLGAAQLREIEARANYNRARAAFARALGTGLRAERLELEANGF